MPKIIVSMLVESVLIPSINVFNNYIMNLQRFAGMPCRYYLGSTVNVISDFELWTNKSGNHWSNCWKICLKNITEPCETCWALSLGDSVKNSCPLLCHNPDYDSWRSIHGRCFVVGIPPGISMHILCSHIIYGSHSNCSNEVMQEGGPWKLW
jgi:hypothetical protein